MSADSLGYSHPPPPPAGGKLPADFARCVGVFDRGTPALPCVDCLRRTSMPLLQDHYEHVGPMVVVERHGRQSCVNRLGPR